MKKILLTLTLSIFVSLAFSQTSFTVDGINYNLTGTNTIEISSGGNYSGSITIPSIVAYSGQTYNVTSIGYSAFFGSTSLTSISIPSSVTSIGKSAFYGCTGLTSVSIPSSVTSIQSYTFSNCSSLTSISIPTSLTLIGVRAFDSCRSLTSITIPPLVTSIGVGAFMNCKGLTTITLPSSVTSIGSWAFLGCTALINVESNNSNYSSKDGVLYNKDFTTLIHCPISINQEFTFPSSVTSIGLYAFSGCTGLTSISIPSSITSIGMRVFSGCTGLTSITIPSSVKSIGGNAFMGCTALINVESNNNNYSSKDGVLYNKNYTILIQCPVSLKQGFTIPSSVISIGEYAFSDCTGLTSISIPSSVTTIEDYAFSDCTDLTAITMPSSVTSIGVNAFMGCTALINVESNNNNYSSKDGVLYNKNYTILIQCPVSLKQGFTIPSSVISIRDYAFYGCTGLTTITFPSLVKSIGDGAFEYCTGLTSISIPSSVTSIGDYAFCNCTALSEIRVNSVAPPTLGRNTFDLIDKTKCTLYVPTGSLNAYKSTEQWKVFLNIVEFDATGVENPSSESIKLYPNLTSSFIHIDLVDNNDSHILKIYNASGEKIFEKRESDNHIQIDVSSYSSGLYFIQTTDQNNRVTNIVRFIRE